MSSMSNIPTSEVLDLAADQIQMHGWGKGALSWVPGAGEGLCLEGGIAAALGEEMFQGAGMVRHAALSRCPAYVAVQEFLDMSTMHDEDGPVEALWEYNDQIAKDATEVIAVLRAAAAVERAKEDCPLGSTPEVQMAGVRA